MRRDDPHAMLTPRILVVVLVLLLALALLDRGIAFMVKVQGIASEREQRAAHAERAARAARDVTERATPNRKGYE